MPPEIALVAPGSAGRSRPPLDLCRAFGPLSSMHAALDREGIGMPCGVVARFPGHSPCEVENAITQARRRFPILDTSYAWIDGRPTLTFDRESCNLRDDGTDMPLTLAEAPGSTWRYRVVADGRDTWLHAVWRHALADGLSMLGFIEAVAANTAKRQAFPVTRPACPISAQRSLIGWLPGFLLDQKRRYVRAANETDSLPRMSWMMVDRFDRDAVLARAASQRVGMSAWLAGAAISAFAARQEPARDQVLLNVPIARRDLSATDGFGFGIGSLRTAVTLDPDHPALVQRISRQLRRAADSGWDRNLERVLGTDPSRHSRFARIQANKPADPNITVSWKGHHRHLGSSGDVDSIACFAAAPTLHVSAHADATGLSLSVTSPGAVGQRHALLRDIADLLGCRNAEAILDLDTVGAVHPSTTAVAA